MGKTHSWNHRKADFAQPYSRLLLAVILSGSDKVSLKEEVLAQTASHWCQHDYIHSGLNGHVSLAVRPSARMVKVHETHSALEVLWHAFVGS